MELELLEALALSTDRTAALAQLLPGSEDHDYFRGLDAQHRGLLDEVDALLDAWPGRHGATETYERLRLRQTLYRLGGPEDVAAVAADRLRDVLGVSHWHEAEVPEVDPTRPTRLADDAFVGVMQLQLAAGVGTNLARVTDEGCQELVGWDIDPQRRRVLLTRIGHTPHPALVDLVAADLATRGSGSFGSLPAHAQLTLAQLEAVAVRAPDVRTHAGWLAAVILRMQPPASVDLELDREARDAYLHELWAFVQTLPPASNSLKAHVLWHLLDGGRRRGVVDRALFDAFLRLPRATSHFARPVENITRTDFVQPGTDFTGTTGLPVAGDDATLVADLLQLDPACAATVAPWLERAWLDAVLATAALLSGATDADRATLVLGPARAAALRDRVDLTWCASNPTRFEAGQPVALDADVKNVAELVVKVFRVDPIAYFEHTKRPVDTDLDLDGLTATNELVLRYAEPAIRRARRHIELPMCARAGTYVIDLIGNGMSSRAVIRTGRLRHVVRIGAAGHVVTVIDEAGVPLPGAQAWLGERAYTADERGELVVPFSTAPARVPMLLAAGDVTSVAHLDLRAESYALGLRLLVEREGLTSGRTARAIARLALTVAGAPASLALLKRPTWDVTLTDRHGVQVAKSLPLLLSDDDATVLEWPLGDDLTVVAVTVRGTVEVISEQREQELVQSVTTRVAQMTETLATDALYLAHTAGGWVVSALGKTGEPRARRPMTVTLRHRWSRDAVVAELATDDAGRVELGALAGVAEIGASIGGMRQDWTVEDTTPARAVVLLAGADVALALPPLRDAGETIERASLVELRGAAPLRHVPVELAPLAGGLLIPALPPGEYLLRAPGLEPVPITIVLGALVGTSLVTPAAVLERSRPVPAFTSLELTGDELRLGVRDVSPRTRVHVLATRFVDALAWPLEPLRAPALARRADRVRTALYVSGRELGDEYRYILDRRTQPRYPGSLLERPSLLLHPWARRTTTTAVAAARPGGHFAPAQAPMVGGRPGFGSASATGVGSAGDGQAYAAYDFLAAPPAVLANLVPDETGTIVIARAALGDATHVTLVLDDPAGWATHGVPLPETALVPRDLRLRIALAADRHATQQKAIAPLRPGGQVVIEDLVTAKVHLLDSLERAHAYLLALRDDPTLREFGFVVRWHALAATERADLYSKFACHELHLFLHAKDRAFFEAVVRPTLVHKRVKTFVDRWLLDEDLAAYVEPAGLARLNAVERALLAWQRPTDGPLVARLLADEVAIQPPDPAGDVRRVDALLGAAALDGDDAIAGAADEAFAASDSTGEYQLAQMAPAGSPAPSLAMAMSAAPRSEPSAKKAPAPARMASLTRAGGGGGAAKMEFAEDDGDGLVEDRARRRAAPPLFRGADRTQEWAETNWWKRTPAESTSAMIAPNRLWRDLAAHAGDPTGFLSSALGLATTSFAESLCALALIDLPFVPGAHAILPEGPRLTITAAGTALVGTSQIVDGELVPGGPPLVVGTSYVRTDDRYRFVDGQQVERYVTGPLTPGVVYTCLVVLANPSSTRQRISALVQIPRGSIGVAGARATHTLDVILEPYGTHGHEYAFYFPAPGTWSHFPVHVSRGGVIVAAAPPVALEVVTGGAAPDTVSWAYVSQRGSLAEVVALLAAENLATLDLERVAWRLKDRAAYDAILGVLEARRAFHPTLWGYALLHRDLVRIRTSLRARGEELMAAGPVLAMPAVGLDAEDLGAYEHLELAPLVNARAHTLGGKLRILNDGLAEQYRRFLDLVSHRAAPTGEDWLAAAAYMLAQDRTAAAQHALGQLGQLEQLGQLGQLGPAGPPVVDRMQHAYLVAYAACLVGDVATARAWAEPFRGVPIERWRRRYDALLAMLDEVTGIISPEAASAVGGALPDPSGAASAEPGQGRSEITSSGRDAQHAELARGQPTFDLAVDAAGVRVRQQHVPQLELRYFEMDIELLFSRQPFVASDVARFSFIAPGHREQLVAPAPEHLVPWPAPLRGKNVVVEGVGGGRRVAKVHYANDLAPTLAHQFGQVRVQRASDRAPLPATYVKVYARMRGGAVAFYKDGYTDLRGWFDYATLSTDDLDRVERFAILVCSDTSGAAILETAPPQR